MFMNGEEFDYRTCIITDKSSCYNYEVARSVVKFAERLQVQMKLQIFDSLGQVPVISLLLAFKLARDTNGMPKDAKLWLLHFPIRQQVLTALSTHIY